MVVDFVLQPYVARRIEPFELIKAHGVPVGHDEAMKQNGKASRSEGFDLAGFAEKPTACRNEQLLAVMGVRIGGGETRERAGNGSVETVDENGFEDSSFK